MKTQEDALNDYDKFLNNYLNNLFAFIKEQKKEKLIIKDLDARDKSQLLTLEILNILGALCDIKIEIYSAFKCHYKNKKKKKIYPNIKLKSFPFKKQAFVFKQLIDRLLPTKDYSLVEKIYDSYYQIEKEIEL